MSRVGGIPERDAWIALASVPGVGELTFERLLRAHGSASDALAAVAAFPPGAADRLLAGDTGMPVRRGLATIIRRVSRDPTLVQRRVQSLGGWLLTPLDPAYPARLLAIEEPPPVLYGLGHVAALEGERAVAMVGTRRPTVVGRDLAGRVARRLVGAGATVVSGLAVGIDGAAHRATIEAGGSTVAVVGSGLDAPGPAVHRSLAAAIARHGAVLSELAPGVRASRGTFPRRNRIISGLTSATIVVEAPARSGALITARHALEQGRGLLVAPGRPLDPHVAGNLALLRLSPARPLVGLDEMVADLGLDSAPPGPGQDPPALSLAGALALLEPTQRLVAAALSEGPQAADQLCRRTGLEAGEVAACLTLLQLRGWARTLGPSHLAAGPLLAAGPQVEP